MARDAYEPEQPPEEPDWKNNYVRLKQAEVEALHRYGERMFGDLWWPGESRDNHSPEDAAVLEELGYFVDEEPE